MDIKQIEDTQLLAQAQTGNKEAFGHLYEKYLDDIYHYLFYRVSNKQDAEDLTEKVFLKAWRALAKHPPQQLPFRLWIYRIAHNTAIDYYRTRKESVDLDQIGHVQSEHLKPEQIVTQNERNQSLVAALKGLKEEHQEVLLCRFVVELTHLETAAVMERSEGAVRILQYRALEALRKILLLRGINEND